MLPFLSGIPFQIPLIIAGAFLHEKIKGPRIVRQIRPGIALEGEICPRRGKRGLPRFPPQNFPCIMDDENQLTPLF